MANAVEDFSQFDLSKEEKDKLVAEMIRYILFKTHHNSGCPIKRDELTQIVTKNYRQRSLPAYVINEAKEKLSTIFGYELKELQRTRPSSMNQGRSSQQSTADAKSYVVLAGGKIPEENLWRHLGQIGLQESDESHLVFGNSKHALEALVQQRYLQKEKVNGPEGNTLFYELAERALDGQVSERIKEYIAQIVKKDVASVEVD